MKKVFFIVINMIYYNEGKHKKRENEIEED